MGKTAVSLSVLFLTLFISHGTYSSDADSGRFAFVPSEGDNSLMVVDLTAEREVKTLPTGKTPHALFFTKEGKGYVNNRGTKDLTVIDGNRFEVIKTISLQATSFQLALSAGAKTLAVAYIDALRVSLIDTTTDSIIKTAAIGKEPEGAFKGAMMKHPYWSRDGRYVYALDNVNNTIGMFVLSFIVGIIGGTYGIGGAAIIVPFCVAVFHLPIYAIAGAALMGTFITSIAGVIFYSIVPVGGIAEATPDWLLGLLFGVGGSVGIYIGARFQKFVPQGFIKLFIGGFIIFVAVSYIVQYFQSSVSETPQIQNSKFA